MLTRQQIAFYDEQGYLHIPDMFTAQEVADLQRDLDWMIETWAERSPGWSGPWRQAYMDDQTASRSELISMHDLYFYAESWMHAVTKPALCDAMADLLDGGVELHHSTMHVKPPETGHPFPMHQDWAFYQHCDGRYVDVLVHLDQTRHANGEIRFLAGSHKQGPLKHVTEFPDGTACTPHLPTDQWKLDGTVAVPARAGDVVCFNIHTVHGSHINQTDEYRRMVRIGYRHPDNVQTDGQSMGRPGLMLRGQRKRGDGQTLYSITGPEVAVAELRPG